MFRHKVVLIICYTIAIYFSRSECHPQHFTGTNKYPLSGRWQKDYILHFSPMAKFDLPQSKVESLLCNSGFISVLVFLARIWRMKTTPRNSLLIILGAGGGPFINICIICISDSLIPLLGDKQILNPVTVSWDKWVIAKHSDKGIVHPKKRKCCLHLILSTFFKIFFM